MSNWKDESRKDWSRKPDPTMEDLQVGCLQRIADAQEAMAEPFLKLLRDVEYLRKENRSKGAAIDRLNRSNAALRGVITRMKKER